MQPRESTPPPSSRLGPGPAYVAVTKRTFLEIPEALPQPSLVRSSTAPEASSVGPILDDEADDELADFEIGSGLRAHAQGLDLLQLVRRQAPVEDSDDDEDDALDFLPPPPPPLALEVQATPEWFDAPMSAESASLLSLAPRRSEAMPVLGTLPVNLGSSIMASSTSPSRSEVQHLPPAMMPTMPAPAVVEFEPTRKDLPPGARCPPPRAPPPMYAAPGAAAAVELPPVPVGEADAEELSSEAAPIVPGLTMETTSSGKVRVFWALPATKLDSLDKQAVSPSFDLDLAGDEGKQPFKMIVHPTPKNDGRRGAGFKKSKGKGWIELKCEAPRESGSQGIVFRFAVGRDDVRQPTRDVVAHDFAEMGSCCGLPKGNDQWDFRAAVDEHKTFVVILEVMPLGRTA